MLKKSKSKESNYLTRMEEEYFDLQEKRIKIERFLISGEVLNFSKLDIGLLVKQKDVMDAYADILGSRIRIARAKSFIKDEENETEHTK